MWQANPVAGALFLLGLLLLWTRPKRILPLSKVDKMSGPQFEQWCANLLRCNGFRKVKVIGRSNDQGTDILAYRGCKKYAIQCKRYGKRVNNKAVQEINAGVEYYNAQIAVVMTNSYFTRGAIEAAERCDVNLWDRDTLVRLMESAKR